jgi:hypothetical protein
MLGVYRPKKKVMELIKMIVWVLKKWFFYPNIFTYYDKYMVNVVIFFDDYNKVYERWYIKC